MKHEPYRDWLFSDRSLAPDQEAAMEAHLAQCRDCRQLQSSWAQVQERLERAAMVPLPTGFGARFSIRLATERARRQRRQAWTTFGLALLGSIGLAALLVPAVLSGLPSGAGELLKGVLLVRSQVAALLAFVSALLASSPLPTGNWQGLSLLVAAAGMAMTVYASLGAIWAAAVYRFGKPTPPTGGMR